MKRWYGLLSKPTFSCMTSDKSFVTNFKYNCKLSPPQNQRGGGAVYDDVNSRGSGGNWWQNRDNRNSGGNWQNNRDDWDFDQHQVNRRETGGSGCPMARGGHSSGGRSFNASSHRANLRTRSPSGDNNEDNQAYQDVMSWRS